MGWLVLFVLACGDDGAALEPTPCQNRVDCAGSEVCYDGTCIDSYAGVEYRVQSIWLEPEECPPGVEYRSSLIFDGEWRAGSPWSQICPAHFGPQIDMLFVPSHEREEFSMEFLRRFSSAPVRIGWKGIPRDVLHYGTWQGTQDGLSIRFDITPVALVADGG